MTWCSTSSWSPGLGNIDGRTGVQTQWTNFSPRLGIAYKLDSKTVLRSGFGRSYWMEIFGLLFNNIANGYPTQIGQSIPQISPYKPVIDLASGPPAQVFPNVPSNGILDRPPNQGATYIPPDLHYPNTIAWNLSLERLIGNDITANVAYVGNVTRNHGMGMQINRALPGPGSLPERRPMFPRIIVGINNNLLNGSTHYESLQLKGNKALQRRLFTAGYLHLVEGAHLLQRAAAAVGKRAQPWTDGL